LKLFIPFIVCILFIPYIPYMYSIDIFVFYVNKKVKHVEVCWRDPKMVPRTSKIAAKIQEMGVKNAKNKKRWRYKCMAVLNHCGTRPSSASPSAVLACDLLFP
jgi:hypothetical protein